MYDADADAAGTPAPGDSPDGGGAESVLCFFLGDVWLGVPTAQVVQVVAMPTIYPVPTTPAHVLGVANLNGQVTPAIDLRRVLDLEGGAGPEAPAAPYATAIGHGYGRSAAAIEIGSRRMVVVRADEMTAGFPVDLVREVVEVPAGGLQEPRVAEGRVRDFARGEVRIRREILTVLALPALLAATRVPDEAAASEPADAPGDSPTPKGA